MPKKLIRATVLLPLLVGSSLALASHPEPLTAEQMEMVSAGLSVPAPNIAQLNSIGALAWAMSEVSATPGMVVVINGDFTARVGLNGNGVTFNPTIRILRPN